MGMFSTRKPRGFEHKYIYYDERKERLRKMEESAKRDLGLLPQESFSPESIRGKFLDATTHLKRRRNGGGTKLSSRVAVVLLVALFLILYYLINGHWFGV